jgi:hypothetical protein
VTQENGYTKVSYYTRTDDENKTIYPIYVYKDMLILSNADADKPSIVKNEYFLYNAGERKKS